MHCLRLTERDRSFLAWLLDTSASFTVDTSPGYRMPVVEVFADEDTLRRAGALTGGLGDIRTRTSSRTGWVWRVRGRKAHRLLSSVVASMSENQRWAELLLELAYLQSRSKGPHAYDVPRQEEICSLLRESRRRRGRPRKKTTELELVS